MDNSNKRNNNIIPSFGRRRSHGLSAAQKNALQVLYKLYGINLSCDSEKISPLSFFSENVFSKIFIEIGFGGGEHLIQNAKQNTNIGFIGCEPFENGVAKVLKAIQENSLNNTVVFNGDARYLLNSLRDLSVDRFYILFPDPWTKKRHYKRRLLSKEFITTLLYSKLKIFGDIIIATDCENYMADILENIKDFPNILLSSNELSSLRERPADFITTRYEQKAICQGKQPFYLRIEKIKI